MRKRLGPFFYALVGLLIQSHSVETWAASGTRLGCQSLKKSAFHQGPKKYLQFLFNREIDLNGAISGQCSSTDLESWPKITDREFHNQSKPFIAQCEPAPNRAKCLNALNRIVRFVKSSKILVAENSSDLGPFDPTRYQPPPNPAELFVCCRESHDDPAHHSLLLMDQGSPFMCQHESSRTFCTQTRKEIPSSGPIYEAAKILCSQIQDEVLCPRGLPRMKKPETSAATSRSQ